MQASTFSPAADRTRQEHVLNAYKAGSLSSKLSMFIISPFQRQPCGPFLIAKKIKYSQECTDFFNILYLGRKIKDEFAAV